MPYAAWRRLRPLWRWIRGLLRARGRTTEAMLERRDERMPVAVEEKPLAWEGPGWKAPGFDPLLAPRPEAPEEEPPPPVEMPPAPERAEESVVGAELPPPPFKAAPPVWTPLPEERQAAEPPPQPPPGEQPPTGTPTEYGPIYFPEQPGPYFTPGAYFPPKPPQRPTPLEGPGGQPLDIERIVTEAIGEPPEERSGGERPGTGPPPAAKPGAAEWGAERAAPPSSAPPPPPRAEEPRQEQQPDFMRQEPHVSTTPGGVRYVEVGPGATPEAAAAALRGQPPPDSGQGGDLLAAIERIAGVLARLEQKIDQLGPAIEKAGTVGP